MDDVGFMQLALSLARKGEGRVEPNPMVGCLLVRNQEIIGQGYHQYFGGPHAEINALADCDDPRSATAYVTLEPCCHFGKTGPCTHALIEAGVSRVVVAVQDPFPEVSGSGISELRSAGIEVTTDVSRSDGIELLRPYLKRVVTGLPWMIVKWAMSLDGKIATASGSSQWISNESSRKIVHQLRGRVDAILTGIGTVIADDPMLNARPKGIRIAKRVIADSNADTPIDSKLVQTATKFPTTIAVGPDADPVRIQELIDHGCELINCESNSRSGQLRELLQLLSRYGATNVLVEAGPGLVGTLQDADLIDEIHCFIGPKVIGGTGARTPIGGVGKSNIAECETWEIVHTESVDGDMYLVARKPLADDRQ